MHYCVSFFFDKFPEYVFFIFLSSFNHFPLMINQHLNAWTLLFIYFIEHISDGPTKSDRRQKHDSILLPLFCLSQFSK